MPPEQLAAIRARQNEHRFEGRTRQDTEDIGALLAEVDRLSALLDTKPTQWVSYDEWDGLELHDTPEAAKHAAEASLENALSDNTWAAEAEGIWWGSVEVVEHVVATERRPWNPETDPGDVHDEWIVYELRPVKVSP